MKHTRKMIALLVIAGSLVVVSHAFAAKISKRAAIAVTRVENNYECHHFETPLDLTPGRWQCKSSSTGPGPFCEDTGVDKIGVAAYDCAAWFDQFVPKKAERRCSAGYGIGPEGGLVWLTVTACAFFN